MRYIYTFCAFNPRHTPMQSETFHEREGAIAWAADAATAAGYHSEVSCTCTSIPDAEYGDNVLDVQTNTIGAVLPGSRELIGKTDVRYPAS